MTAVKPGSIGVEGNTLEEALENAARELSVPRNMVEFDYDREHLASGASTVRVYARKRIGEPPPPPPPSPPSSERSGDRGDRGGRWDDRGRGRGGDRGGERGGRDRGPPRDDRGGRGRGGPPRGGGDRDRGRGGDRDRGRGGDRGPPRDRPQRPDRDSPETKERDERLRSKARALAERVLAGEGPQAIEDLNSYERHLVHTVVAEVGGLESKSSGESLRKTVHITKAGATPPAPAAE